MQAKWILLVALIALQPAVVDGEILTSRAPDGVPVDVDGNPRYGTFSLCAIDPETGESGVAVNARVPFVGRERRQLGMIDMQGRSAAFSGAENGDWNGSRQGENDAPVAEMKRIYYRTARRLGYRTFSEVAGDEVVELKRLLHALGYWRPDLEVFPEPPDFDFDVSKRRSDPEGFSAAIADYRKKQGEFDDAYGLFDEEAIAAVQAFREKQELEYQDNPRGLVDRRLV